MNRHEFLVVTKAIIGSIAVGGTCEKLGIAQDTLANVIQANNRSDDYYLSKGLIAMARAKGWFDAHWGAAIVAGNFLCRENDLDDETKFAVRKQMDAMIQLRAWQFNPFPEAEASADSIEEIASALLPALKDGLRAHGHAAIFASLSIKALRRVPHMAQPKIIAGICNLSHQIAKQAPREPSNTEPYASTQSMIEANFESLARFEPILGRPTVRRPNFTHMTTHTEALVNLDEMGYRDLSRAGHIGHRAHMDEPIPHFAPDEHPKNDANVTLGKMMNGDFWSRESNVSNWSKAWNESKNPNGYWVAFGHLFKVLYSFHRLIDRMGDRAKVDLCSQILLERYWNPNVLGG